MGTGANIRALREKFGLTQDQLAEKLGVTRESVHRWETDKMTARDRHVSRLIELFGVEPEDIKSEKYGLAAQLSGRVRLPDGAMPVVPSSATVPLLTIGRVHAGAMTDEDESDYMVEFPRSVAERHPGCFALRVEGDCMNRRYPEGCHIMVDPNMEPRNGSAVVAEFEDGRSVLRNYLRGSSTLMLTADSFAEHEDIIVTLDDPPVRTVGVVVWYQADKETE